MSNSQIVAVVPASGIGARMQQQKPKQYLLINGLTILEHTLHKLLTHPQLARIVVVIHPQDAFFQTLPVADDPRIEIAYGGASRAESVYHGLQQLQEHEWALVHDAARPCITHSDIDRLITAVLAEQQGGILAMPLFDTIKKVSTDSPNQIIQTIDRSQLWAAATPQMFKAGELRQALAQALSEHVTITDEASAMEYVGRRPLLIAGRRDNIKVTQPEDLLLAQFYLSQQSE